MSKVNYQEHQKARDGKLGWSVIELGQKTYGLASAPLAPPFRERQINEARFQGMSQVLSNRPVFQKSLVSTFFPGLQISFLLERGWGGGDQL